jgi:integrase
MPRSRVPSYRIHKPSGQAVVTIRAATCERRDVYLGAHNSPESRREYARILAELATSPATSSTVVATGRRLSVDEVLLAFWLHAERHYRTPDGKPATEVEEIRRSILPQRKLYGHTPAAEFGPKALAAVRQEMICAGWCRALINRRMERIKRVFRWAAAEVLVPVTVYQSLRTLSGLQKGRTAARESGAVKPVDPKHMADTLPHVSRHVRAMVQLQQLTGMRPGEVCGLTLDQVDRTEESWAYGPERHKTAHRGKPRAVPLGPKARALLAEFVTDGKPPPEGFGHIELNNPDRATPRLIAADAYQEAGREHDAQLLRDLARPVVLLSGCVIDPEAPVFSPAREREERFKRWRAARKSKVQPSQLRRKKENPAKVPSSSYHPHAYSNAIVKACKQHGIPHWHPNMLRHLHATELRRRYGLEAAQAALGHARADVTQVYAERDLALAARVANEMG